MIPFLIIYVVIPGLILIGWVIGSKIQLTSDAEQSIKQTPCEEWRVAVFKAQMKAEKDGGKG